jgi:hypothetical protein
LSERHHARAAIVSTHEDISQVLHSMAFDELFDIRHESVESVEGEPIPTLSPSKDLSLQVILSAHRRLMEMSDYNRSQFSEVVKQLEQELSSSRSKPS